MTDIHQAKTVRILIASPSERPDFHHAITPFSFYLREIRIDEKKEMNH